MIRGNEQLPNQYSPNQKRRSGRSSKARNAAALVSAGLAGMMLASSPDLTIGWSDTTSSESVEKEMRRKELVDMFIKDPAYFLLEKWGSLESQEKESVVIDFLTTSNATGDVSHEILEKVLLKWYYLDIQSGFLQVTPSVVEKLLRVYPQDFVNYFILTPSIANHTKAIDWLLEALELIPKSKRLRNLENLIEKLEEIRPRPQAFFEAAIERRKELLKDPEETVPFAVLKRSLIPDVGDQPEGLLSDPAFVLVPGIPPDWIPDISVPDRIPPTSISPEEARLMIARALYFEGVTDPNQITKEMISRTAKEIQETRKALHSMPLFKGREVLLLASKETWEDGKKRFGTDSFVSALKAEHPKRLEVQVPPDSKFGAVATIQNALEWVRSSAYPITFYYDGHGDESTGVLNLGTVRIFDDSQDIDNPIGIDPSTLAHAFVEHSKHRVRKRTNTTVPDIIILGSCYSSNFIQNFYKEWYALSEGKKLGKPPVMIALAEYGQVGYSKDFIPEGNEFNAMMVSGGKDPSGKSRPTTLGDVFQLEGNISSSNPVVIAPRIDLKGFSGKPLQLVDDDVSYSPKPSIPPTSSA